jgi:hypothetical protein
MITVGSSGGLNWQEEAQNKIEKREQAVNLMLKRSEDEWHKSALQRERVELKSIISQIRNEKMQKEEFNQKLSELDRVDLSRENIKFLKERFTSGKLIKGNLTEKMAQVITDLGKPVLGFLCTPPKLDSPPKNNDERENLLKHHDKVVEETIRTFEKLFSIKKRENYPFIGELILEGSMKKDAQSLQEWCKRVSYYITSDSKKGDVVFSWTPEKSIIEGTKFKETYESLKQSPHFKKLNDDQKSWCLRIEEATHSLIEKPRAERYQSLYETCTHYLGLLSDFIRGETEFEPTRNRGLGQVEKLEQKRSGSPKKAHKIDKKQ